MSPSRKRRPTPAPTRLLRPCWKLLPPAAAPVLRSGRQMLKGRAFKGRDDIDSSHLRARHLSGRPHFQHPVVCHDLDGPTACLASAHRASLPRGCFKIDLGLGKHGARKGHHLRATTGLCQASGRARRACALRSRRRCDPDDHHPLHLPPSKAVGVLVSELRSSRRPPGRWP